MQNQQSTLQQQLKDAEAVQRAHLTIIEPIVVTVLNPTTLSIDFSISNVGNSVANEISIIGAGEMTIRTALTTGYSSGPKLSMLTFSTKPKRRKSGRRTDSPRTPNVSYRGMVYRSHEERDCMERRLCCSQLHRHFGAKTGNC
jgi:hypothetical protein